MKHNLRNLGKKTVLLLLLLTILTVASGYQKAEAHETYPVIVPADVEWVSTGIWFGPDFSDLVFNLHTTGVAITIKYGKPSGPAGGDYTCYSDFPYVCLLEEAQFGALIGKFGSDGTPFLIGDATTLTIPYLDEWTPLYLSINDYQGTFYDNRGQFNVKLVLK